MISSLQGKTMGMHVKFGGLFLNERSQSLAL